MISNSSDAQKQFQRLLRWNNQQNQQETKCNAALQGLGMIKQTNNVCFLHLHSSTFRVRCVYLMWFAVKFSGCLLPVGVALTRLKLVRSHAASRCKRPGPPQSRPKPQAGWLRLRWSEKAKSSAKQAVINTQIHLCGEDKQTQTCTRWTETRTNLL